MTDLTDIAQDIADHTAATTRVDDAAYDRLLDEIVGRQIGDDENACMDAINVTCIEG